MMKHSVLWVGLLATTAACGNSPRNEGLSTEGLEPATGGQGATQPGGVMDAPVTPAGGGGDTGSTPGASTNPAASGASSGGSSSTGNVTFPGDAATESTATGSGGTTTGGATTGEGTATGGALTSGSDPTEGTGGANAGTGAATDETGGAGAGGVETGDASGGSGGANAGSSGCVGQAWTTADPRSAGPFQVTADKNVGPLAGDLPDPIYGDEQQRFNVYRPANLADTGYCHPILIWANGYTDNPEPNPPQCVVDQAANKWCGQYLPMMNHLASHGFVVVASLSTATGRGNPLPTLVGLDWILEQAEEPSSPYYQRLDTANVGQLGHSFGGMSTCMSASDPRYKALATICGTSQLNGVHTPMLFFCGGRDTTVDCSGVRDTFLTVTDQPAFFINELNADHGSWVYEGPGGVSLSSAAAWFRAHLMGDTENRKYFYGADCTFCSDNRVQVEQNNLMAQ